MDKSDFKKKNIVFNKSLFVLLLPVLVALGKLVRYTILKKVLVDQGIGHNWIGTIVNGGGSFSFIDTDGAIDAGVNPDRMTISSDGQGSLPMYSSDGEFLGMGVGQSSCLLKEVKECVFKTEIPLEIAISTITSNPADILRLKGKGKVEEGYDADLCILDQELQLVEVIAKGNTVYTK